MKKFYGSVSNFPEYKIASSVENPSVVVLKEQKREKKLLKDLPAFLSYFNKKFKVINLPQDIEPADLESQIKKNFFLYNLFKNKNCIYVLTEKSVETKIKSKEEFLNSVLKVEKGKTIDRDKLIEKLVEIGFVREDFIENEGEFSVKGGFVSVYIPFTGVVDIDFFGDEVENIYLRSKLETKKKIPKVEIFPLIDIGNNSIPVKEYLNKLNIIYIDVFNEPLGKGNLYFISKGENPEILDSKQAKNTKKIKLPITSPLHLKNGVSFIPENGESVQLEVEPLREGDYIIHEDYGIGIFRGIETRNIKGKTYDFMVLEYANNEKIYVSYLHFDKIFRYKASGIITLDHIGGTSWRNLKRKVKSSLQKVARQLIKLYAERNRLKREPLDTENELIFQFERDFPFIETPDQLKAIKDVKKDLSSEKPMERIVCGDVGFGKTEVALRATFINVVNGKQVLVLTPTTVLSYQHYRNFKERLEPYSVKVENLSRLKSKKETERILKDIERGTVDVVIGTHKALSEKVKFKNLGLLVIDEEHRFGVRAKEKIRQIKKDIDTLYMTATPIPRTLNMALSGLKDMSVINTPPEGRIETKTYVLPFSEETIKKAIEREIKRNGQVFYVYNRIETIKERADYIKSIFPDLKVEIAHGKMKPKQIEKVILDFIQKKIDILVSTSIIETGIDIPTANTLIVERADLFGLSQLYHLRGRVGRGNIQAYCYLLTPSEREITESGKKRLDTIKRLTRPGSGLKVSIEDMQIRGAGNILGVEQSGHIKAVGYEMYIKLLQEAINEETGKAEKEPVIVVDFESYIPEDFIKDPTERLNIYMAVSKSKTPEEIEKIKQYLNEFYNTLPAAFNLYLEISKIKKKLTGKGISKIELKEPVSTFFFDKENPPEPEFLQKLIRNLNIKNVHPEKIEIFFSKDTLKELSNLV